MKTAGKDVEKTFAFSLISMGPAELTQGLADANFEAGCDDALLSIVEGRVILEFDRPAPSFREALSSAIDAVERSGLLMELIGAEP